MYAIDRHVGRLIEVRIRSPVAVEELDPFLLRLRSVFPPPSSKVAICVDLEGATVFPPEVSEGFVTVMRGDNPRLERSAFLVSASAVFSLQIERMIRAAGSERRRSFRVAGELAVWLGEVLTHEERTQLARFLAATT